MENMEWTTAPEMTTAVTNIVIAVSAAVLFFMIRRLKGEDRVRSALWQIIFALLCAVGIYGFFVHAIVMDTPTLNAAWMPLSFIMGLMVASFTITAFYETLGRSSLKKAVIINVILAVVFFLAMLLLSKFIAGYFVVFIAYSAVNFILCVVLYAVTARKRKHTVYYIIGILLMMAGSALQAMRTITFTLIWQFDYNTVYHLFLLAALFFFYTGYKKGCACGVIPTRAKRVRTPEQRKKSRIVGWSVAGGIIVVLAAVYIVMFVPLKKYDFTPSDTTALSSDGTFSYNIPLDSRCPWAKFRANELNNGRSPVKPVQNDSKPWSYRTGKGIFSSPVVDENGVCYVGSADHTFYAINEDGTIKWSIKTGEIIDSSALIDDKGLIYFGSGDANVYCADKDTGEIVWKSQADTTEEVEKKYNIVTYNVNWFEGNIGMLPTGELLAPNDNYLVYRVNRETGEMENAYLANEMVWSVPSVNASTNRLYFASCYQILKNVFSYDMDGARKWLSGSFGTVAATTMLTSDKANGAVVVGSFDGYVRAFAQDNGKLLWKVGTRDHIYASPAQLSDGTIIQASTDGTVYAINADGKVIWQFDTLEPIRSSPAVDGNDNIYFGSGEGKLYCINKDGTLRWSYQCITESRDDLNSSPALGFDGVYIAGESGQIFYVPYDYPLTAAGKADPRCYTGGEQMPADGANLVFTTAFGSLEMDYPKALDANEPVTLSLLVRENGDDVLSALDRGSVQVDVSGNKDYTVDVGATNKFINITPKEYWTPDASGKITVTVKADVKRDLQRFGLKFFGGRKFTSISQTFTFDVNPVTSMASPFITPDSGSQSVLEFYRLSAPTPSMLPSYNQIGFDSLHFMSGVVSKTGDNKYLMWVIEGKLNEDGTSSIDPSSATRYPLELEFRDGLVTLHNYSGFKINFIGSWDMPFGAYRLSSAMNLDGSFRHSASMVATANCDDIAFYGAGLKLVGMSDFDTGKMYVRAGTEIRQRSAAAKPDGVGSVALSPSASGITAGFSGSALKAEEHVYSIMLVDTSGSAAPLYYTADTHTAANSDGTIKSVTLDFLQSENVKGSYTAYVLVDTFPVYSGQVTIG
jgi:outer membrane protein assembly factor BamB